jgi:hypothetical protein
MVLLPQVGPLQARGQSAWTGRRSNAPRFYGEFHECGRAQRLLPGKDCRLQGPCYLMKITDNFPMTVTGKIQKFRMKEVSIEDLGLQETAKIEHDK